MLSASPPLTLAFNHSHPAEDRNDDQIMTFPISVKATQPTVVIANTVQGDLLPLAGAISPNAAPTDVKYTFSLDVTNLESADKLIRPSTNAITCEYVTNTTAIPAASWPYSGRLVVKCTFPIGTVTNGTITQEKVIFKATTDAVGE